MITTPQPRPVCVTKFNPMAVYTVEDILSAIPPEPIKSVPPPAKKIPMATANGVSKNGSTDPLVRVDKWMERREQSIEGQAGDKWAFTTACQLVREFGLSDDDAFDRLAKWNQRNQPPFTPEELWEKIRSARKNGKQPVGSKLTETRKDYTPPASAPPTNGSLPKVEPSTRLDQANNAHQDHADNTPATPEENDLIKTAVLAMVKAAAKTAAAQAKPKRPAPPPPPGKKVLLTGVSGQKAAQILEGIRSVNAPLKAFVWGPTGKISSLRRDGPIVQCSTSENLAHLCESTMGLSFHLENQHGIEYPADAPEKAYKRVLGTPTEDLGLPIITEFIEAPVLATDETIIQDPGFHPSGLYYRPSVDVPPVPPDPSPELVAECLQKLYYLVADFPFEGPEDRQAYFSYLFTGFVAAKAPRPWPMWHYSAPCQGSGKGFLAASPGYITTGRDPGTTPIDAGDRSDAEIKKTLTSVLYSGAGRWLILDNAKGHLSSPSLESLLTTTIWRDRILGGSKMGEWVVNVAVALTGNNLSLSPDLERRQILVRLTPDTPTPWLRNDFKIPNLLQHIVENRAEILWQILVLVQRWVSLGFPQGKHRLGSFEGWSAAMGGLLDCVGIGSDFLSSSRVVSGQFDPWMIFVQLWADSHVAKKGTKASDLVRFTEKAGVVLPSDRSPAHSLGKRLARQVGRMFFVKVREETLSFRLTSGSSGNNNFWNLEEVQSTSRASTSKNDPTQSNPVSPVNPAHPDREGIVSISKSRLNTDLDPSKSRFDPQNGSNGLGSNGKSTNGTAEVLEVGNLF